MKEEQSMKQPVVIIGIGEIGSVFARGFLRCGHPVYPITRDMDLETEANNIPNPELVLIAVGETALQDILTRIPQQWRSKIALIQNELLPTDWQQQDYSDPTVISVWFEKKKGQDVKVVVPSPTYGPHAQQLANALDALDIPNEVLQDEAQLLQELVRKNYYILTTNIAGLKTGGSVSELWEKHEDFARTVLSDIYKLQAHLTDQPLDHEALIDAMVVAFKGDPDHQCMGRSAPARLARALQIAEQEKIEVAVVQGISDSI
ncbi:MAG: hypothetical protein V3U78_07930 [Thiotrichaceae bacterium]